MSENCYFSSADKLQSVPALQGGFPIYSAAERRKENVMLFLGKPLGLIQDFYEKQSLRRGFDACRAPVL